MAKRYIDISSSPPQHIYGNYLDGKQFRDSFQKRRDLINNVQASRFGLKVLSNEVMEDEELKAFERVKNTMNNGGGCN